VVITGSYCNCC